MDAQRTRLKAKRTGLLKRQEELEKSCHEYCEQMLLLTDYRALDSLVELETPTINEIASNLLQSHAELLNTNVQLERIHEALYG